MSFIISLINAEIMQVLCFGLTPLTIGIQVKTKQMLKDASKHSTQQVSVMTDKWGQRYYEIKFKISYLLQFHIFF